jgi:rod shape-determining protein MreC
MMFRSRAWWVFSAIGVLILVVLLFAGFFSPLRRLILSALLPPVQLLSRIGSGTASFFHIDPASKESAERVAELEARLRSQTVDYVQLSALEEENRSLRAAAGFLADRDIKVLGARVISRSISDQTAVVMIDRGSNDGIEIGQAVIAENGLYVGKVISLTERTANIMLLTDVRSRVAASTPKEGNASGVIEGRGSGVAHFTLIPQSLPLKRDDVVVTAGTEEKVPANLVIGLVNDVDSKATDPFKNAVIEPLAPLQDLNLVSVILASTASKE